MGAATSLYSAICFTRGKYGNGNSYSANLSAAVGLSGWLPCAKFDFYQSRHFSLLILLGCFILSAIIWQDSRQQTRRSRGGCKPCCIIAHSSLSWQRYSDASFFLLLNFSSKIKCFIFQTSFPTLSCCFPAPKIWGWRELLSICQGSLLPCDLSNS